MSTSRSANVSWWFDCIQKVWWVHLYVHLFFTFIFILVQNNTANVSNMIRKALLYLHKRHVANTNASRVWTKIFKTSNLFTSSYCSYTSRWKGVGLFHRARGRIVRSTCACVPGRWPTDRQQQQQQTDRPSPWRWRRTVCPGSLSSSCVRGFLSPCWWWTRWPERGEVSSDTLFKTLAAEFGSTLLCRDTLLKY